MTHTRKKSSKMILKSTQKDFLIMLSLNCSSLCVALWIQWSEFASRPFKIIILSLLF